MRIILFQVVRTSDWSCKNKPFKECFPMQIMRIDERRFKSFEEYDKCVGGIKFVDEGFNHRITKNGIARDMGERSVYGIKIDTLKELMDFKDKVGEEVVLTLSYIDNKTPCLEIYDDYRE